MVDVTVDAEYYDIDAGGYRRTGETIDVSQEFADEHPHLVTPADESDEADAPFDPSEFTVDELGDKVGDLSDGKRQALADAERDGEDRDSAIDVLEG